jgi:two-component system sensor histidine kinase PhoQ
MALRPNFNQNSFHPHSLGMRVMLSAFFVLFIFNLIVIAVLDHANKNKVIENYSEQLELQLYNLLAVSEYENGEIQISSFFNDKRFNEKDGDLIAIIIDDTDKRVWDSFSAKRIVFESPPQSELGKPKAELSETANKQKYLIQSLTTIWDSEQNAQQLTFLVGLNTTAYAGQISEYRKKLIIGSLIVIASVLVLQGIILFFGFQSLNKITKDLKEVSLGNKNSLDGRYPKELQSVSFAINQLIESERAQKHRYQKSLADLAHSLKTPLSVLQSHSEHLENKSLFSEQIERLDQIISYQLQRAAHSGSALAVTPIEVKNVIKEINKALEKVYHEKNVSLALKITKGCLFYGDKNDLMELLGNLMDNAYKHCQEKLLITVEFEKSKNQRRLYISIEDDGIGIDKNDREFILQRGARVDSLNPGQGIGLAIVVDIVKSYHGQISITESSLGGACFNLEFKQDLI